MEKNTTGMVGLMADPGWPMRIAKRISSQLAEELSAQTQLQWEVEVTPERLPLDSEGEIPLFQHASRLLNAHSWDYLLYLTDLPLLGEDEIMLAKASAQDQAALISIPSLGATRTTSRVKKLAFSLIMASQDHFQHHPSEQELEDIMGSTVRYRQPRPAEHHSIRLSLSGQRHRVGLLMGTIRSNQPTQLLGALTNSIALGAATGAFGIFYGSVWNLADALSPVRLLLIGMIVSALMGFWLILKNSLWAPARKFQVRWQAWVDILATTATIAIGVFLLYFVLFGALLLLSLIVVESAYLAEELRHPAGLSDYLKLSWLSSSLGMFAGALGSNFNSEESIREATYSNRVYEHRQLADEFEDPQD